MRGGVGWQGGGDEGVVGIGIGGDGGGVEERDTTHSYLAAGALLLAWQARKEGADSPSWPPSSRHNHARARAHTHTRARTHACTHRESDLGAGRVAETTVIEGDHVRVRVFVVLVSCVELCVCVFKCVCARVRHHVRIRVLVLYWRHLSITRYAVMMRCSSKERKEKRKKGKDWYPVVLPELLVAVFGVAVHIEHRAAVIR